MSIQAVSWALSQDIRNSASKLVLISLANHASHIDGRCFPKISTIAKEASLSTRSVQRHLPRLVKSGFIRIEKHFDGRRQTANTYWLLISSSSAPPNGGDKASPLQKIAKRPVAPGDETMDTPGGATRGTPINRHNFHQNNLHGRKGRGLAIEERKQPKLEQWKLQRGRFESELAGRIGDDGIDVLANLEDWKLEALCLRQSQGLVTEEEIDRLKSR